jgi:hypothetical protein
MLGCLVVALDAQIVNAALPEIRSSLGGGLTGLQLARLAAQFLPGTVGREAQDQLATRI